MRGLNILKQSEPVTSPNKNLQALKTNLDSDLPFENDNIFSQGEKRTGKLDLTNRDYLTGYENPTEILGGQGLDEVRANTQSWGSKAASGVGRAIAKAGVEIAKMPGIVVGAITAPFAEEGQGWDTFVNNAWTKTINEYGEQLNQEVLPVYVKKAVSEGNLWDNLSSIDFWATEGADGVGFIASMFAPGALMKSFNLGSKVTKFASMSNRVSNAQKALGITPQAIDTFAITAANTMFESAAEAGSAMDSFEKDLNLKLENGEINETQYEAMLQQKATLGRDIFVTNLAILAGPNLINTKLLYGLGSRTATAAGVRSASGELLSEVASPTILNKLGNVGKEFSKALGREGFFEEGLQSTTEEYFKKGAESGTLTDNYLNNINAREFADGYLDMLTSTDGQKAIALGGLLGGGMQAYQNAKQSPKDRAETNRLLSLGREANDIYLATTLNPDIYKRTEEIDPVTGENAYELVNGKKVIDPVKRNELVNKAKNADQFSEIFDYAQSLGNSEALQVLQTMAEDNLIMPFITNNEVGIDILKEYLKENKDMPADAKQRVITKAEKLQSIQNEYLNFSKPILNLKNNQSTQNDVNDFHSFLNNTLLVNKSQEFQANENLNLINKDIQRVLSDKGYNDNLDDNVRLRNELASTDIRLESLLAKQGELNEKIETLKSNENLVWNKKEQQKAFDKFIKDRRKTEEKESNENIEVVNETLDKINNSNDKEEITKLANGEKVDKIELEDTNENATDPKPTKTEVTANPLESIDSDTKEIIKQKAQDKIEVLVQEENDAIAVGNAAIDIEKETNNASKLEAVRKLQPIEIAGVTYTFSNFLGILSMNTSDFSDAKNFDNMDSMVNYIDNILNSNIVLDNVVKPLDFETSDEVHTEQKQGNNVLETSTEESENLANKKFPTISLMGIDRVGKQFNYLSEKFYNWLKDFKDKKGTKVTFSPPDPSGYNPDTSEAIRMLNSGDFSNKDFLYRKLPLQVNLPNNNFTFIASLTEVVDENSERYIARKNIVEAILNNSGNGIEKYNGLSTTVDYQKGGELNYIAPNTVFDEQGNPLGNDLVENNISNIQEFNNRASAVPLFFVRDEQGNVYDENGNDGTDRFPSNLTSEQKGYVYTIIKAHNGVDVPVKMNVRKLSLTQANLVYEVYRTLYELNKGKTVRLNQNNAKLTDLYKDNASLQSAIEKFFEKEINLFRNKNNITVADFMTLFIHDSMALDGSAKPYTVKYKGGGITFGTDSFINFEKSSSDFKDAFIDFITSQKRQNVKLDYLAGINKNINKAFYKDYLINEKVINVNLDTNEPFKGDINVYINSQIDGVKSQVINEINNSTPLQNNVIETLNNQNDNVSLLEQKAQLQSEYDLLRNSDPDLGSIEFNRMNEIQKEIRKLNPQINLNTSSQSVPGAKGGRFSKKNNIPPKPDGFSKTGC